MRRISTAITLTVLLLASLGNAQQTTSNASPDTRQGGSPTPPPGPIIGGDGTPNYLAIWARTNYLLSSVIYQASEGNVGIGTTTPAAKLDVNGIVNATVYNLSGFGILSAPYSNLFVGISAGASGGGTGGTRSWVMVPGRILLVVRATRLSAMTLVVVAPTVKALTVFLAGELAISTQGARTHSLVMKLAMAILAAVKTASSA